MKSSEDTLTESLDSFTKRETWTFVSQMKSFVEQNTEQARIILQDYPQLAKALLLAQVKLEMVSNNNRLYDNPNNKRKIEPRYDNNKIRKCIYYLIIYFIILVNGMGDIHANSYNSIPPPPPPPPVAMQPGMPSPYMPYYPPQQRGGGNDWNSGGRYNDNNNISDPRLRSRDPRMQPPPPPR